MGAGYLPEFGGRKKVRKSLLSVPGFLLRLNRGTIMGWLIALLVLGAAYGSVYGDMETFLNANELLKTMFQLQGMSIETSFTMTILVVLSGLAMIMPIALVNHLFTEESQGHLEAIYATKTSRDKMYWGTIVIAASAGALALMAASAGLGGAAVSAMEIHEMELIEYIKAGLNYFPAVLFVISLAGLILGWFPGWGKVLYVYVGYSILLNYFLNILNLPDWVEKTAILSWIPRMPVEEFDLGIFVGITGISVGLLILGYIGYGRRDLQESV